MPITIDPVRRGKRRPRRVSKKTTKTPTAKQKQLQKLKDMRNKVMGTQKVMTAQRGGSITSGLRKAIAAIGGPKPRFMTGRSAAAKKASKGISAARKTAQAKFKSGKGNPAGKDMSASGNLSRIASSFMKRRKALKKSSPAAEAFKKARQRKPSGRLTADDLKRSSNFLKRRKELKRSR
mgnify:FL=1|tara:strand:+ start:36 stop:572 length:537 start_codon:yes stop_codon:yes gene_type:complete